MHMNCLELRSLSGSEVFCEGHKSDKSQDGQYVNTDKLGGPISPQLILTHWGPKHLEGQLTSLKRNGNATQKKKKRIRGTRDLPC